MNNSARVESIEALTHLRTFLCIFAKNISGSIDDANCDIIRTLEWLKNDRYPYWKKEIRKRNDQLVKAKLDLKQKQAFDKTLDRRRSYIDEKKALAAAQRRFDEAQDKLSKIRKWIPRLEQESYSCLAALQRLSNVILINIPNRTTQLDQMICALESYVGLSTPLAHASNAPAGLNAEDEISAYANIAHDMESSPDEMEQLCKSLRQRHPLEDQTSEPTNEKLSLNQFKHLTVSKEMSRILKKNTEDISSFSKNDALAFDTSIENSDSIYLENLTAAGNKQINWYIGPVKPDAASGCSVWVCKIPDILKSHPTLNTILSLPKGWLVILENNLVKAVFDANNKLAGYTLPGEST